MKAWRWAGIALVCTGCSPQPSQPWRTALDEGKVVKLGGSVGKLEPPPTIEKPAPSPIVVAPDRTPQPSKKPAAGEDPLGVPPTPKAVDGKLRLVIPAEDEPPPPPRNRRRS